MDTASRGGRLDDDFISTDSHQGSPHSSEDSHDVSRLSDVSAHTIMHTYNLFLSHSLSALCCMLLFTLVLPLSLSLSLSLSHTHTLTLSLSPSLCYLLYVTCLSCQDYDWRQYASRDDDNEQGLSLQSRLAGSHHRHPHASVEVDQSLSGSTSMVSHYSLQKITFFLDL